MSANLAEKPNVLAVDDKPANLLSLEAVLQDCCHMLGAHSGEEAISILRNQRGIDVILMDVHMPRMDGYETAREIKGMPECTEIPIIFITAVYLDDAHVRKGYEAGGIDYFGKPFDPEILRMKIAAYATFRQRAKALQERERYVRASEELLSVGRKLASVLENLPVGVLIADREGRICQSTEEVSRIFCVAELEENGAYGTILDWWNGAGKKIRDSEGALIRALREGESSHNERVEIACPDGTTKLVLKSTSPLRGLDGNIVGAVILVQDVTGTQKIEKDLEERVNRLIGIGVELEQSARR